MRSRQVNYYYCPCSVQKGVCELVHVNLCKHLKKMHFIFCTDMAGIYNYDAKTCQSSSATGQGGETEFCEQLPPQKSGGCKPFKSASFLSKISKCNIE